MSSEIDALYGRKFARSAVESSCLTSVLAGGAAHDGWRMRPFGVIVDRADGPYKWTVDGERLIDFWMGHGALLFGHGFGPVVDAVRSQALKGTHFGASHPLQREWAQLVRDLVPGAERVRFTASGTEATLLALRAARAVTGRKVVLKFDGHFHGWHDASMAHFVSADASGLDSSSEEDTSVVADGSLEGLKASLDDRVAAVIIEPGGGGSGALPWSAEFLADLHEATRGNGSVLIFDETVSGFRYSPGGVQALAGVVPELTVLGKILAGGLPGAALAGRAAVMDSFGDGMSIDGRSIKVPHTGTFNANPLSAAAGVTMLRHLADGAAQSYVSRRAEELARGINAAAERSGVDVGAYQQGGIFHLMIGAHAGGLAIGPSEGAFILARLNAEAYASLRKALLLHGVDMHPVHGWLATAHSPDIVEQAVKAFAMAFEILRNESALPLLA